LVLRRTLMLGWLVTARRATARMRRSGRTPNRRPMVLLMWRVGMRRALRWQLVPARRWMMRLVTARMGSCMARMRRIPIAQANRRMRAAPGSRWTATALGSRRAHRLLLTVEPMMPARALASRRVRRPLLRVEPMMPATTRTLKP
jgi:hypothetical protein